MAVAIACASTFTVPARADRVTDAEELFRRAKVLVSQSNHVEACPLFAESYRLDPGVGTLLNLALCHEQIGKSASAWGEFRAVEQQALGATPPNEPRARLAREHGDKLQPRLSRIKVIVPPSARTPGLVIKVDGEEKVEALWSVGIAVDPGVHIVEASAPHKKTATSTVKLEGEGVLQTVELVALDDAVVAPAPSHGDTTTPPPPADEHDHRTAGYIVGGVGLAVLATGGAFGIAAIVDDREAKDCEAPCYRDQPAGIASDRATDRALLFANLSNVTVALGAIGVLTGAWLVFTGGPSKRVALSPSGSVNGAGLDVRGLW